MTRKEKLVDMIAHLPHIQNALLKMPGARPVLYIPINDADIADVRGQIGDDESDDVLRMAFDHALIDEGLAPYARPLFPVERSLFAPEVDVVNCVVVDVEEDTIMRFLLEQLPEHFDYTRGQVLVVPAMPTSRYLM